MIERRKPFWIVQATAVLLIALVGYPLSYGPAVRIVLFEPPLNSVDDKYFTGFWAIYAPLDLTFEIAPEPIRKVYDAYFEWWTGRPLSDLNGYVF